MLLLRQQPAAPLFFTLSLPARSIRFLAFDGLAWRSRVFIMFYSSLFTSQLPYGEHLRAKPMCCFWSASLTHPRIFPDAGSPAVAMPQLGATSLEPGPRPWLERWCAKWRGRGSETTCHLLGTEALEKHESHIESPEIPTECFLRLQPNAWAFREANQTSVFKMSWKSWGKQNWTSFARQFSLWIPPNWKRVLEGVHKKHPSSPAVSWGIVTHFHIAQLEKLTGKWAPLLLRCC